MGLGRSFITAVSNAGDGGVSEDLIASILWGADKPPQWREVLARKSVCLPIAQVRVGKYVAYCIQRGVV